MTAGARPALAGAVPASVQQLRTWSLLAPADRRLVHGSAQIAGALDADLLAEALRLLGERHDVLRMTFAPVGDGAGPLARAGGAAEPELDARDPRAARGTTGDETSAFVADCTPWDLERGPALRARLLARGSERHELLIALPALRADAATLAILVDDLAACYRALAAGAEPPAPPALRWSQVVAWLATLAGEAGESPGVDFWRRCDLATRAGARPWFARPQPAHGEPDLRSLAVRVGGDAATRMARLAEREGAAAATPWLAAWQLLLARLARAPAVLVGIAHDGRDYPELRDVAGPLARRVPVGVPVEPQPDAAALVRRLERACAEARRHSDDLPWLADAGSNGAPAYCPFAFDFRASSPSAGDAAPGEPRFALVSASGFAERFDLGLACELDRAGVTATLTYDARLLPERDVRRTAELYAATVESIARDPAAPAPRSAVPSPARRSRAPLAAGAPLAAFDAQAALAPERIAVTAGAEQLSYGELQERANRLANWLLGAGAGPEAPVAVCLERSPALVVAVLATLRAGAPCALVDPEQPPARRRAQLAECGARLAVADSRAGDPAGVRVVCPDRDAAQLAARSPDVPSVEPAPDAIAYVAFTSGSTGAPKAAANTHRGLANLLAWMQATFALDERDRVLHKAPLSFDVAVWELLWPLCAGARLVLARPGGHRDPAYLCELIREQAVTTAHFVPPLLEAFLDEPGAARCEDLARVLCGGAPLAPRTCERFFATLGAELHHLYGPAETAIDVTWRRCRPGERFDRVPIGRPIANVSVHLLDERLEPVPAGVPGELCIGGAAVGRGYAGRPAATAAAFVPDPFSSSPGARLYRSGDLAVEAADGTLEFAGRIDDQVKLMGVRIEPGEIEAALLEHAGVRRAAVVASEEEPGRPRLVAYFVGVPGAGPEQAELRDWLASRLPRAMIPASFVRLRELPLTAAGKLDRRALPRPGRAGGPDERDAAPRTPVEEVLAATWAEVLGAPRVRRGDDFFELGGHSLAGTRMMLRANRALGAKLPLQALFEAPTLAALAERFDAVRGTAESGDGAAIEPVPRSGPLPLSFAQERLWFVDRLSPGDATYNVCAAVRLDGPLDVGALERTVAAIVARHEVLRTTFVVRHGAPSQSIADRLEVPLPVSDLRGVAPARRDDEVARRLAAEIARPFDLERGPLVRASLLRLDERSYVLALAMHHIVCDDWSVGIVIREAQAIYPALRAGRPAPLPPLGIQYADYAAWQRSRAERVLATQLPYWRRQLHPPPPRLRLPLRPEPADASAARGGTCTRELPAPLVEALRELARGDGATLFMTLLAAYFALLARLTGETDVAVGSPVANRGRREAEDLIGFFVNFVVLRADLAGDPSFRDLLARTRDVALAAYAHQDVPFERLVEELAPGRDAFGGGLFDTVFVLQNAPRPALAAGDLTLTPLDVETGTAKYALVVSVEDAGETLRLSAEYDRARVGDGDAERLLRQLEAVLAAVVEDPSRRVSSLPLLDRDERRRLVADFNSTRAPYPRDAALGELFERQRDRTPDALAVAYGRERLTYRQLDARAAALAGRLLELGVERGAPVALCAEPSAALAVGALAIVKAGGAYMPLDPDYPAARLDFMVADSGARVLVTTRALRERVRGDAAVVLLDEPPAPAAAGAPTSRPRADDVAYVLYTSGSTGTPKGVELTHRGAVRLVHQPCLRIGPGDRVAQLSSPSFDAFAFELWAPLVHGAALVGIPRTTALAPRELAAELRALGITVCLLTTALFNHVARSLPGAFAGLREVWFGGEAASAPLVESVLRAGPPDRLCNVYGPTECATLASLHEIRPGRARAASVPIGRPLANTELYVLDGSGEPVPPGVPGRLHVGGDALARGYLGRPRLTAERFVPSPFGARGERLYDTGDLARQLPDGTLEFVGRDDLQVKVRGQRVELGEVEAVLRRAPGVADAVVSHRRGPGGETELVAHLVPVAGAELAPDALRDLAAERLPAHMLPSAFVALEALPLTPNGKVDRDALPPPGADAAGARADEGPGRHVAPRSTTERRIARIWARLLELPRVGAHDDFFALGGHSLLATRAVAELADELGVELPLRTLFESPTVAAFAARVDAHRAGAPAARVPARGASAPATLAQQHLWRIDRALGASSLFNVNAAARLRGPLDVGALARCVELLGERHAALRTSFAEADGRALQRVDASARLPLAAVDLESLPQGQRERAAELAVLREAAHRFDLTRGPLARVLLARLGAEDHVLSFTAHHIVCDGWSLDVLLRELASAYAALADGRPPDLPALERDFVDFAAWQSDVLARGELERERAYWRERLAGRARPLALASDAGDASPPSFRTRRRSVALQPGLVSRLRELARRERATPFMVMLAALTAALHRRTGARDLCVGTLSANRTRTEFEGVVGCFLNTLVLRTGVDGDPTLRELLREARATTLEAQAHGSLPFEDAAADAAGVADPALFQVMLLVDADDPASALSLAGVEVEPFATDAERDGPRTTGTTLDLMLRVSPEGDGMRATLTHRVGDAAADALLAALVDALEGLAHRAGERLSGGGARPTIPNPS